MRQNPSEPNIVFPPLRMKKLLYILLLIPFTFLGQESIFVSDEQTFGHAQYNDVITKVISKENYFITLGGIHDSDNNSRRNIKIFENNQLINELNFGIIDSENNVYPNQEIIDGILVDESLITVGTYDDNKFFIKKHFNFPSLDSSIYITSSLMDSISSVVQLSDGRYLVAGSQENDEGLMWWFLRSYDQELNFLSGRLFKRINPTDNMNNHSSTKVFEMNDGRIAHFGTAKVSNGNYGSYITFFNSDSILSVNTDAESLSFGTSYVIKDVIKENISGEERFFVTGYRTLTGSPRSIVIASYDSNGNDIFESAHNLGSYETGNSIKLTNDNYLMIVGRTQKLEIGYAGGTHPFYGNEYGDGNYNFFIHKVNSDDGATEWTCVYGSERHEELTDFTILDNKEIILVGNQQSDNGVDLANNPNLYLDQHVARLNISGCTKAIANNFTNIIANYNDESCLYSQNIFDSQTASITSLENSINSLNLLIDSLSNPIKVNLNIGWNMIGFSCPEEKELTDALSEIVDEVLIMKNNNGSVFIPEFSFNGIGDLTPGHGYQIKVTDYILDFNICE